jgi:hypothetical protein
LFYEAYANLMQRTYLESDFQLYYLIIVTYLDQLEFETKNTSNDIESLIRIIAQ